MNKRTRRNSPSKVKKGYLLFVDLSAEEETCWGRIMMMQCGYIDSDICAGMQSQDSRVEMAVQIH